LAIGEEEVDYKNKSNLSKVVRGQLTKLFEFVSWDSVSSSFSYLHWGPDRTLSFVFVFVFVGVAHVPRHMMCVVARAVGDTYNVYRVVDKG
jgi:hypothetical protein